MRSFLTLSLLFIYILGMSQQSIDEQADSLHLLGNDKLAAKDYPNAYYFFAKEAEVFYLNRQAEKSIQRVNSIIKSLPADADTLFIQYNYLIRVSAGAYSTLDNPNRTEAGFERVLNHCLLFECDSAYLAKAYRDAAQSKLNMRVREGLEYLNKAIEINKDVGGPSKEAVRT